MVLLLGDPPGFLRFPRWLGGKESACKGGGAGLTPGSGRSPKGKGQPTPVFLPGESHGQRSLVVHGGTKSWTRLSDWYFWWVLSKEGPICRHLSPWQAPLLCAAEPGPGLAALRLPAWLFSRWLRAGLKIFNPTLGNSQGKSLGLYTTSFYDAFDWACQLSSDF